MKITNIELAILESPFDYGMAAEASDSRGPKYALIVKVHTDAGITGIVLARPTMHGLFISKGRIVSLIA